MEAPDASESGHGNAHRSTSAVTRCGAARIGGGALASAFIPAWAATVSSGTANSRAALSGEDVILLSDHSPEAPETIFHHLKVRPEYDNRQEQALYGSLSGQDQPVKDRLKWGAMRMEPTDIADVTGATYTHLVNGHGPQDNWTGLLTPGEPVRVTLINDSMMGHPIHLHGHYCKLVTGHGDHAPRKHTVLVQPDRKLSFDIAAATWRKTGASSPKIMLYRF